LPLKFILKFTSLIFIYYLWYYTYLNKKESNETKRKKFSLLASLLPCTSACIFSAVRLFFKILWLLLLLLNRRHEAWRTLLAQVVNSVRRDHRVGWMGLDICLWFIVDSHFWISIVLSVRLSFFFASDRVDSCRTEYKDIIWKEIAKNLDC